MPTDDLVARLRTGDRRALARAITLTESRRPDHRSEAERVLQMIADRTPAIRIGISGTPGVGKSSFIEAFGMMLVEAGHRVGVLAIDPSSARSGGSILGDKTRMVQLARHDRAFVRPSPAGGTLGGVAARTGEGIMLCEAAGMDVVLVETVGIGQSETAVANITDLFVLLVAPGGGDDLQGIKRGVMELADLVVVNKADGELEASARHTAADYRIALQLMRPRRAGLLTDVLLASALAGTGLAEVWSWIQDRFATLEATSQLAGLRADQQVAAFRTLVREGLDEMIRSASVSIDFEAVEEAVRSGELTATGAANDVFAAVRRSLGQR